MEDMNFKPCPKCRIGYLRAVSERKGGFSYFIKGLTS